MLDVDATDDPVHGEQECRFFHGYYGHYCYLPLYIFSGEHLLGARLRPASTDASAGVTAELARSITCEVLSPVAPGLCGERRRIIHTEPSIAGTMAGSGNGRQ